MPIYQSAFNFPEPERPVFEYPTLFDDPPEPYEQLTLDYSSKPDLSEMYEQPELQFMETENQILIRLEASEDPETMMSDRFLAGLRLGGLAFASSSIDSAQAYQHRAYDCFYFIQKNDDRGNNSLPTVFAINARAMKNLNPLLEDLYVYGEISYPAAIQLAQREFLKSIKHQVRRYRNFMAKGKSNLDELATLHQELTGALEIWAAYAYLQRGIVRSEGQPDEIYLPSVIDTSLEPETEDGITLHRWHIGRYTQKPGELAELSQKIIVRLDHNSSHDLDLDPDTVVIWLLEDFGRNAGISINNRFSLPIDLLLDIESEKGTNYKVERRAQSVERALTMRTIGSVVASKALAQLQ